jgi:hypothetical protein
MRPVEAYVELPEREHREVRLTLGEPAEDPDAASGAETACYVGIAVGALGVVVGALTGGISLSAADDEPGDGTDRAATLGGVAAVSFAVGGAGAITALVAGILWAGEPAGDEPTADVAGPGAWNVAAELGPGWVGLRGTF